MGGQSVAIPFRTALLVALTTGPALGVQGFITARSNLAADLSLLAEVTAAVLLSVGVMLARRGRYEAHRWVQTSAVGLNTVPVVAWMVWSLTINVLPHLPADLARGSYALATVHAVVGAIGVVLGLFVVIRANQLTAQHRSVAGYKPAMRAAYTVYVAGVVLGVILYVVAYG